MRKILLIGELSSTLQQMAELLKDTFWVQLASEDAEHTQKLKRVFLPDLVLWYGSGAAASEETVAMIRDILAMGRPPVLGLESADGIVVMRELKSAFPQFEHIARPVTQFGLRDACMERLGMKPTAEAIEQAKVQEAEQAPKKILVIDDSALELRRISRILDQDYEVLTASGGKSGLESAQQHHPDLIFLDYEMPGVDGKMTLEMLSRDAECAEIPVVFLSGVDDKARIMEILSLSPRGYLLKPAVPELLHEKIQEILG